MASDNVKIVNVTTGEEIERQMTPEELAQREADAAAHAAAVAEQESAAALAAEVRASAVAKLAALGLSESEVLSLIGE